MIRKKWFHATTLWLIAFAMTGSTCFAQVTGNGKVVKEDRKITDFRKISVGNAINLEINQGAEEKVVVEADENILPYIKTNVTDGKLEIGVKGNIHHSKAMNVYVTVKQLSELEAGSAAQVKTEGKIESSDFKLSSGSGSAVKIGLNCTNLKINTSSGTAVVINGSAQSITVSSSSGSALVTSDLKAEKGDVEASSGAVIVINVTKELKARASSGANVTVQGNPAIRDTDSSSGGSVHYK